MRSKVLICGLLGGLIAPALTGCGSDERKILDTERIERAIQDTIFQKRHIRAQVSCPAGTEQKKGVRFTCTATYPRGRNPFVVTQDDDRGAVHYEGIAAGGAPAAP
ncbi:MAG: hypothetical protein QOE65_2711 [Solirubrobacteraceae bacterium]|jgi:hypothetical protein|nr:hypothetical protein [Solirubrobacteraceae bacterium]